MFKFCLARIIHQLIIFGFSYVTLASLLFRNFDETVGMAVTFYIVYLSQMQRVIELFAEEKWMNRTERNGMKTQFEFERGHTHLINFIGWCSIWLFRNFGRRFRL